MTARLRIVRAHAARRGLSAVMLARHPGLWWVYDTERRRRASMRPHRTLAGALRAADMIAQDRAARR